LLKKIKSDDKSDEKLDEEIFKQKERLNRILEMHKVTFSNELYNELIKWKNE